MLDRCSDDPPETDAKFYEANQIDYPGFKMNSKISSWNIGDVKITRIIEAERAGPMFVVPDAVLEEF